jgi:hypothetical protein
VLLDDGLSCEEVAKVLFLDDDTVRRWHAHGAGEALNTFVTASLPRNTRQIGAFIEKLKW